MNILSRLKREDGGSYIIEFAVLALPMMTMLMGAVELGYMSYTAARVEGTVREVSRLSATGYFVTDESTEDADDSSEGGEEDDDSAPTSLELIAEFVAEDLAGIPGVTFDIDVRSYQDFQDIQNPEPITQDADPIGGVPGPGDCFIDVTENGVWDANIPGSVGIGGSEDIVYFGLAVEYPPLFTLSKTFSGDKIEIDVNSSIKNEPFASAASYSRTQICIEE